MTAIKTVHIIMELGIIWKSRSECIMIMKSFVKEPDGIILQTTKGQIKVQVCSVNIIRVVYTLNQEFSHKKSLMVVKEETDNVSWKVEETDELIEVVTNELRLRINKGTCAFSYFDGEGNLLMKEPDRGGKNLIPTKVVKTVFDENTDIKSEDSADGVKVRAENAETIVDRTAYHWKLEFEWGQNEALYGLGSYEEGIMNYRNHHQYLYQQNMRAVVPCLVSTKGYGVLFDSYSFMTFHDDVYGSYLWSEVNDELDYYFIYGPELDEVVSGYRYLTGQVPMFPKWAFGYIQSKERYTNQDELISIVQAYRKRKVPLDVIVLDWMSWEGNFWGQKSLDPVRFPNPEQMMEDLHKLNARLMVSIWPNMQNDGPDRLEMKESGFLLGNQSTYDAFNEQARELYWKQAYEGLFSKGIDAWWCDCTEPFENDWRGTVKAEPEQRIWMNVGEAKKYLDPQYINAYSLLHSQGIYEGQRATTESKRVVNLTRSAYAGQQRYGTITWSGDIAAKWDTLKKQIVDGLNFCATGIPYWTLDIGGFFVSNREHAWFWNGDFNAGCEDLGYRELYVRWFQYGTFLPIFRSHGTDTPREVWRFGEPGSVFYDTLVKFDYLRYRLIPYLYSLSWQVSSKDYTLMRALPFDFRSDEKTYDIGDQYMFGPAFLVNPVTWPMYYQSGSRELEGVEKARNVYLPSGTNWYDFWTGEQYQGGQIIKASAELEIMPLYVKAGSIVPMGPKIQYTSEKADPIELRIYPGADAKFELYNDEGDNYNYEKGHYQLITITWDDHNRQLLFSDRTGKGYTGMPKETTFKVVIVDHDYGIGIEETQTVDKVVVYRGESLLCKF